MLVALTSNLVKLLRMMVDLVLTFKELFQVLIAQASKVDSLLCTLVQAGLDLEERFRLSAVLLLEGLMISCLLVPRCEFATLEI